jgi:hypothetical protein
MLCQPPELCGRIAYRDWAKRDPQVAAVTIASELRDAIGGRSVDILGVQPVATASGALLEMQAVLRVSPRRFSVRPDVHVMA